MLEVIIGMFVLGSLGYFISTFFKKKKEDNLFEIQDADLWLKPEEELDNTKKWLKRLQEQQKVDEQLKADTPIIVEKKPTPVEFCGYPVPDPTAPITPVWGKAGEWIHTKDEWPRLDNPAPKYVPPPEVGYPPGFLADNLPFRGQQPDLSLTNMHRLKTWSVTSEKDKFFIPQVNVITRIRILPTMSGGYWMRRKQHYLNGFGSKNKGQMVVQCDKRMEGTGEWKGECPICDLWTFMWSEIGRLEKNGQFNTDEHKVLRKEVTKFKGMERTYFNVLVKEGDGPVKGPLVLSAGMLLGQSIRNMMQPLDDGYGNKVFDLLKGHWLILEKTMHSAHHQFADFHVRPCRGASPAGTINEIEKWMANSHDLEAMSTKWTKTRPEIDGAIDAALKDSNLTHLKRCVCGRWFKGKFLRCSLECHQKFIVGGTQCSWCGERELVGGKFVCGGYCNTFYAGSNHCKHFPACVCNDNEIGKYPIGCKCYKKPPSVTKAIEVEDFYDSLMKL